MYNPASSLGQLSQSLTAKAKSRSLGWSAFLLLTLGFTAGWSGNAQAESPETAPPQLKDALSQIDAAANSRNLQAVMQFYGTNFKHSDGLTRASMEQALTQLWERYPELTYRTELQDWTRKGDEIIAETVTYITGSQPSEGMAMKLEATLRSRQHFENQTIVQQDILAERTQLTSGVNPPTVDVQLPNEVRAGQEYNFDVIVKEPLGDDFLLGTALEEPVKSERYTTPADFALELLPAGGIFKVGKAPSTDEDRWISAVLIRGDGMTMITQRLPVVGSSSASKKPST
jgi:hypothetical protein